MKKILITGANSKAYKYLKSFIESLEGVKVFALGRQECDVADSLVVSKVHDQISPDLVINLSAYTDTYMPDQDPKEHIKCYKVNALGPKNLAMATNSPIIHISTNYVFSSKKQLFAEQPQFYTEHDDQFLGPETAYGMHKLIGENNLRLNSRKYYILRTQWLFEKGEDNFLSKLIDGKIKEANLDDISYGIPTSYKTLSEIIFLFSDMLIKGGIVQKGIYNAVNSGSPITIYQLAKILGQQNHKRILTPNRVLSIPLSNNKLYSELDIRIPTYTNMF